MLSHILFTVEELEVVFELPVVSLSVGRGPLPLSYILLLLVDGVRLHVDSLQIAWIDAVDSVFDLFSGTPCIIILRIQSFLHILEDHLHRPLSVFWWSENCFLWTIPNSFRRDVWCWRSLKQLSSQVASPLLVLRVFAVPHVMDLQPFQLPLIQRILRRSKLLIQLFNESGLFLHYFSIESWRVRHFGVVLSRLGSKWCLFLSELVNDLLSGASIKGSISRKNALSAQLVLRIVGATRLVEVEE